MISGTSISGSSISGSGATPSVTGVVNRRPTTDPGTVGTRSPDTRLGGL